MTSFYASFLGLLLTLTVQHSEARKSKSIAMIYFRSNNGYNAVASDPMCQAAIQVATSVVNARDDILPGYNLRWDFLSQGDGSLVPTVLFNYLNSFEKQSPATETLSPIIMGNSYTRGCHSVADTAAHIDMVAITYTCGGDEYLQKTYKDRNYYLGQLGTQYFVFPLLHLMRLAGWKKLAIVSLTGGQEMQDMADRAGYEVVHFESSLTFTQEHAQRLKDSDARIISYIGGVVPAHFYGLLCWGYLYGLRGSRYVYMIWTPNFNDFRLFPNIPLPYPCTADIVKAQYAISFWGGIPYNTSGGNNGPTNFGYDLTAFEDMFNSYTNNTKGVDYYYRLYCHDSAMKGIVALDAAEKLLQTNYNSTLSDYSTNPDLIVYTMNQIIPTLEFKTLGYGSVNYSGPWNQLQPYNQPLFLHQSFRDGSIQVIGKVSNLNHSNLWADVQPSYWTYQALNRIIWATEDGQPPRDFPSELVITDEISSITFGIIVAIAVLISVVQSTIAYFMRNNSRDGKGVIIISLLAAFISLNAAACLFAINPFGTICFLQRLVLVGGHSTLSSFFVTILGKLLYVATRKTVRPGDQSPYRVGGMDTPMSTAPRTPQNIYPKYRHDLSIALLIVVINCIVLIIWFGMATMTVKTVIQASRYYDDMLDAYVTIQVTQCISSKSTEFTIVLVLLNFIALAVASVSAISSHKIKRVPSGFPLSITELRLFRYATLNVTVLDLLTVFIVAVLGLNFGSVSQNVALAFMTLLVSIATSGIMFVPMLVNSTRKLRRIDVAAINLPRATYNSANESVGSVQRSPSPISPQQRH